MATLSPSNNPQLAIHLSDRALTPLISTARSPTSYSSTSQSQSQAQASALSSLTTSALTAYDSSSRLSLGLPQRIMIETSSSGPLVLHSFLSPRSSSSCINPTATETETETNIMNGGEIMSQDRGELRALSGSPEERGGYMIDERGDRNVSEGPTNGVRDSGYDGNYGQEYGEEREGKQHVPMLIATVVTGKAEELGDARRAAARLERMGREFQGEWVKEKDVGEEGEGDDG